MLFLLNLTIVKTTLKTLYLYNHNTYINKKKYSIKTFSYTIAWKHFYNHAIVAAFRYQSYTKRKLFFYSSLSIFSACNLSPQLLLFPCSLPSSCLSKYRQSQNWISKVKRASKVKMPQMRDNAGAVCDSGMGMLFLNRQFLSYRGLLHQKMG